jgi:hypothetical protein
MPTEKDSESNSDQENELINAYDWSHSQANYTIQICTIS